MMKRNKIISERSRQNNGFTLIEVIAVLVIAAILTAVVVVRGMSTADVNLQAEVDTLKSHLRYAQYQALNDIAPVKWGINLQGSSYTLVRNISGDNTTFDSPFRLPNESSATHDFSPVAATNAAVLFNEWGSPNITSITFGGQTIAITANTGFMP